VNERLIAGRARKLLFSCDNFSIDTDRRELRRGGELCSVEPQVFDLLEYLLRNRDRVVSRDDLLSAVWNGRIVSEATLASRINAARIAVGDNGEHQRLIRTIPRRGVRFVGVVRMEEKPANHAAEELLSNPILPDKPSIAVLPFTNMSGHDLPEYFADGIVEEIITALSRFSSLFVIARNSSFTYKGRAIDVKQVGRELGVRYVLEGSVRKGGQRVRITGQLIDAATGAHIWADRFDGAFEDVFDLQDQVTASVVASISPKIEQAEIKRAKLKPTESLDAYDYFLHGKAIIYKFTSDTTTEALRLFCRAIELDPGFASAYGMAAWCYVQRKGNRWATDGAREVAEVLPLARKAVDLGRDDAVALATGGYALAFVGGEQDIGSAYIDRALTLNPNLPTAWFADAWLRIWRGEPEIALRHFTHLTRLSPFEPITAFIKSSIMFAHCMIGQFDKACALAEQVLREAPDLHMALRFGAASFALAGRWDEAGRTVDRLRRRDPLLRVSDLKELTPLRRPEDLARYEQSLRQAGLPE
jgi:TolB-like protein